MPTEGRLKHTQMDMSQNEMSVIGSKMATLRGKTDTSF